MEDAIRKSFETHFKEAFRFVEEPDSEEYCQQFAYGYVVHFLQTVSNEVCKRDINELVDVAKSLVDAEVEAHGAE